MKILKNVLTAAKVFLVSKVWPYHLHVRTTYVDQNADLQDLARFFLMWSLQDWVGHSFEWVACAQEEELSKYGQGMTRYFFICHTARKGWWTAAPDCTFFVTCCEHQCAISKVIIIDLVVPGWFDARQSSCTLSMRSVRLPSFRRSVCRMKKSQKHNDIYTSLVESPGARRHLPYICCRRLSSRFGYEFEEAGDGDICGSEPMQHVHSHTFL